MTSIPIKVLVTAVGGDLGQAVVKALMISRTAVEIHGCDSNKHCIGQAFVQYFHLVPHSSDEAEYWETVQTISDKFGIVAIIPASEPEISVLSRHAQGEFGLHGTKIISRHSSWTNKYGDKLTCMQHLSGRLELAPFADGTDTAAVNHLVDSNGFPLVVKARRSSGSRHLYIVNAEEELAGCLKMIPLPIVQGYIDDSQGEFSVGVFCAPSFSSTIIFRRTLGPGGCSWIAETVEDPEISDYAKLIAQNIDVVGSANIQVRRSTKGIRLLEVNPRFSSLAAARAACGFNDVEWSLQLHLDGKFPDPVINYKKISFQRFLSEMIDFGDGFRIVSEWTASSRRIT
jgi:carbamoyl-phosphate synthase large subunit